MTALHEDVDTPLFPHTDFEPVLKFETIEIGNCSFGDLAGELHWMHVYTNALGAVYILCLIDKEINDNDKK